jgi:putative ABC transport system permease protein
MRGVDLGFQPEQVYAFDIYPPPRYADEDAARSLYGRLIDRVAAVPGVRGAAFVNHTPLGGAISTNMLVPGVAPDPNGADAALYKTASDTYASVMGLRVVRGRWFTRAEVDARTTGVIVSEAVARRFWPDADPIGRSITVYRSSQARPRFGEAEPSTVLGVVAPVRHFGPAAQPPSEIYLPYTRDPWGWGSIVVRSAQPSSVIRRRVEQALVEVEPELPLSGTSGAGFRMMSTGVEDYMAPRRMSAGLAGALAVVALLVASLGLYALAAYSVSQRTGEFGVRMALGATPRQIVQRVLLDGGRLALVGVVAGVFGATWLGRILANQLFETSATDPVAIGLAAAALVVVLLVALWIPARRAAQLDPTVALRAD